MGEIGSGVVEFQQAKGAFSQQIKEARANYWASYNGPGFDAAAAKFREALLAKDLIHLSIYLAEGRPMPLGQDGAVGRLVEKVATVDGGIAPPAREAFWHSVDALRQDLGAKHNGDRIFVLQAQFPAILAKRQDLLVAYIRARDWYEVEN